MFTPGSLAANRALTAAVGHLGFPAQIDIRDAFATTSSTNDDEEWRASDENSSGGTATCASDYATTEEDT